MAVQKQARALVDIKSSWGMETEESILANLSYEKFQRMLLNSDSNEEDARKFRETLASALLPIIQQAMTPQQPGQPPAQGQ